MWVQIAILIISYLIAQATAPKPQDAKRAVLDDFDFPQADEGTPQAVIFGDVWVEDWTVTAVGNYRAEEIVK